MGFMNKEIFVRETDLGLVLFWFHITKGGGGGDAPRCTASRIGYLDSIQVANTLSGFFYPWIPLSAPSRPR